VTGTNETEHQTRLPGPIRLSWNGLDVLPSSVSRPRYEQSDVRPGVVHFGVGAFHRSHFAAYLDALMDEGRGLMYGVVGVGTQPGDERMRDALSGQDCLYTLVVKHPDGTTDLRIVGSIVEYLYAPDAPGAVLARLADPETRIVSLTITEGGYHVDPTTGDLDVDALRDNASRSDSPRTVIGFVVEGLRRRRAVGVPPFTLLSCDNLPGNGRVLRTAVVGFAALRDAELAAWINDEVAFPCSMVDRITPVTTSDDISALERVGVADSWPVVCEPFAQWVLEDDFPLGRPEVEEVGVHLVDDVGPYELMKLRLLNGSHQALCYLGRLTGYTYAHEVCQDPLFARFVLGYMDVEAAPTLPPVPGIEVDRYSRELLERFANPAIRDTLDRLCAETSDRIPTWVVPVIHENLAAGRPIDRAALVLASWARYAEGTDESGAQIEVVDRRRTDIVRAAQARADDPHAFVRDAELFGDLAQHDGFTTAYGWALTSLHALGARATLAALEHRLEGVGHPS
jgi:mannitol 2-dehydrogenase